MKNIKKLITLSSSSLSDRPPSFHPDILPTASLSLCKLFGEPLYHTLQVAGGKVGLWVKIVQRSSATDASSCVSTKDQKVTTPALLSEGESQEQTVKVTGESRDISNHTQEYISPHDVNTDGVNISTYNIKVS